MPEDLKESKEHHKLELIKRTNRRRQAWTALISMIAVAIGCFFLSPEKLEAIKDIVTIYFITCAGIVAAYHGSSAWITKRN